MKLLVDENLSPSLVTLLSDLFPGSENIYEVGLGGATDTRLWEYARTGGLAILSKDNDFRQRAFVSGAPPKVVVTEGTVRTHVSNILDKLHLASRTQATLYALREGLASLDDVD